MPKAALITTEKKSAKPVLIVDKEGVLGEVISLKLKDEFLVVFVSKKSLALENIVSVPFPKKVPSIPDNTFSHIILVAEENTKQLIKIFQKKAQKDGAKLSIVFRKKNSDKKIIREALEFYSKTNVLIIGEIFAEDFIFDPLTDLNKLIISAKSFGKVELPDDGSGQQSPILLQDAVDAILEAIFVEEKSKLFYIFPKNNTTLLSLALMLKKKNPHLKLDFIKQKTKEDKFEIPQDGKYMLETPYNFEEKVKKINLDKIAVEEYALDKKEASFPKLNFLPIVAFLIALFFLPILSTLLFLLIGNVFVNKNTYFSQKSYEISNASFPVLKQELGFLNLKAVLDLENNILTNLTSLKISTLQKNANEKIQNILIGKSSNPEKELSAAVQNYKTAFLITQEYNVSSNLDKIVSLSDYFSSILGIGGGKNYLILLENSGKLWPGGGKIEYYGILSLENGHIKDFKIFEAKTLNDTLKNHVEPPFAIRRYLPSVNWYFEDSNFNVDFSKDATAAVTFLNSQTQQSFDGVIAADSYFVDDVLKIIGKVEVKNYVKSVDAGNFFDVVNKSSDDNFKKQFYNSFFLKLSKSNQDYDKLFNNFLISSNQKHVVFAFNSQSQEVSFSLNELGSSLLDSRQNNVNDFFGINEANFGAYNNQIQRSINQEITIEDDGSALETVNIDLKNSGETYKNYFRIILPAGANISSISIDGVDQKIISAITDPSVYENKKFVLPSGLEVEKYAEDQKTVYGFLLNVQSLTTKKITVTYALSQKIGSDGSYGIRIFKQPGIDNFSYGLQMDSTNFKVVNYPNSFVLNDSGGQLSTVLDKDLDLNFKLVPK